MRLLRSSAAVGLGLSLFTLEPFTLGLFPTKRLPPTDAAVVFVARGGTGTPGLLLLLSVFFDTTFPFKLLPDPVKDAPVVRLDKLADG